METDRSVEEVAITEVDAISRELSGLLRREPVEGWQSPCDLGFPSISLHETVPEHSVDLMQQQM